MALGKGAAGKQRGLSSPLSHEELRRTIHQYSMSMVRERVPFKVESRGEIKQCKCTLKATWN